MKSPTPEDCRWIFKRMMETLYDSGLVNAGVSAYQDLLPYFEHEIMLKIYFVVPGPKTEEEIIKNLAGFGFMPEDIKEFHKNPKLAYEKYPKSK